MLEIVIPLYKINWVTKAVLEGLNFHYSPKKIHIISSQKEIKFFKKLKVDYLPLKFYDEDIFFCRKFNLTKNKLLKELVIKNKLYTKGWFYQQCLKIGANDIIKLPNRFMIWDADMLPVNAWPITDNKFALLQDSSGGNPEIIEKWKIWIKKVLEIEPVFNHKSTFICHHMIFNQNHLESFKKQLQRHYKSDDNWLKLLIRSFNDYETFSEYWAYTSWVNEKAKNDLKYFEYEDYGASHERFFDDGTGLFSHKLKESLNIKNNVFFYPSYLEVKKFIEQIYKRKLPSSLSFEMSKRHLNKKIETIHIEEKRSKWNIRFKDF